MSAGLVAVGTFFPVLGSLAVAIAAVRLRGPFRWVVLIVGPILVLAVSWILVPHVLRDGNMLAAVIYVVFAVSLFAYYPALPVVAVVARLKRRC
jgi:hypothetical protein